MAITVSAALQAHINRVCPDDQILSLGQIASLFQRAGIDVEPENIEIVVKYVLASVSEHDITFRPKYVVTRYQNSGNSRPRISQIRIRLKEIVGIDMSYPLPQRVVFSPLSPDSSDLYAQFENEAKETEAP